MPIEFNCESCSKLLRVPDGTGGKQCLCPGCSKVLDIPIPQVSAPANTPANSPASSDGTDIALCIPCPKCKHELICDPSLVGTKGQCRSCKHIFVINDLPTDGSASSEPAINWVFSCPKCDQLFEGNEAMRGKRGKCHACGEVFSIEIRVADEHASQKPFDRNPIDRKPSDRKSVDPETSWSTSNRLSSFDDADLTLDLPRDSRTPIAKPDKTTTSSGTVVSRVSRSDLPAIQFNCKTCKGRMEVPGEAAQQLTHCPHCKRQLTVPTESEPSPDALAANDPWANLSPLGPVSAPMPESSPFGDTLYPPPMPMSPMTSSVRRRSGDPTQHIVCGIFISLFALIAVVIEIFEIVINAVLMIAAGRSNPVASGTATWFTVFWTVLLILSVLQLVGGISLARRVGINTARIGVIICCLPCFCLINIAFGVWGCLLVFGNSAERDFR